MNDEINYQNNPLHGLSLKNLLIEIVDHYGFEILFAYLNINCFNKNPSIDSAVKYLKKTDWAREKVEAFYLYKFKSLPRASDEQFELPPRDRIVPPNKDIEHGFTLSLGDATLRFHQYGTAHTPFDLAIEVPEDRIMCVGDILMDRRIANMEDGSYKGTLEAIDALIKNSKTEIWAPAHGDAGAKVLEWQRSLFEGIYDACTLAVKQGIPLGSLWYSEHFGRETEADE